MSVANRPLRLLLVTDVDDYAAHVADALDTEELVRFAQLEDALRHVAGTVIDCVLLDLELAPVRGVEAVERVLEASPQTAIVVLTAGADEELAARMIRAGAHDVVVKAAGGEGALAQAVRHAIERQRGGERLESEQPVHESGARRAGYDRIAVLGVVGLIAAFCVQLAVLSHVGGVVLWALLAVATVVAWRATKGRRDDARLLQSIFEGSSDGVVVKDLAGRYLLVNDAATRLLGLPGGIVGRTDSDLLDAQEAATQRARDEAVLATGEARRHWRTVSERGVERPLSIVTTPYRDGAGRIVGVVGTVRDESATRQLEAEASRFFDLAPDMLCTAGADGRLERVNEAWTTVLGWTADELRSRPLRDFLHPQDRVRAGREIELMLSGVIDRCTNRLATRAGGWRDVEWTARVVPEDARIYAVVRDVTDRNAMEGALTSSEARYRTLVHNIPNSAVITYDHDLRFTFAAGEALVEAGLDTSMVGRTLAEVWPDYAPGLTPRYRAALGGHPQTFEFSGTEGVYFWVQIAPLRNHDGTIEGGMAFAQDVTALKATERELKAAEERFRTAFEQAPIGMGLIALDGSYLRVNAALCEITGYDAEHLLETNVNAITHPDDVSGDDAGRAELLAGRIAVLRREKRYLHADGHAVWVSVHATLVRDADGAPSHILGQIQDITERRRFEERLQELVDHDSLTGLYNRRRFEQELERHVTHTERYGAQGALLVLDLDDFKAVNDTLGHHAGDELIIAVAGLLKAQLRDSDVIARLGGDEFAILLPAGTIDEAAAVAAKLVRAVRDEVTVRGTRRARRITTSVGVAPFAAADLTGAEVLVNADLAMYEAKEAGRDRHAVYVAEGVEGPRVQARMAWVERIRDALEEDRFVLYAQPILDLRTGAVAQHELLIRMRDDDGSLIPPGAFLQVAERFDLVQEIDRWVARSALDLIATHADQDVRLTVNLSGRTLTDDRLLADLEREIERTGADPTRLTFEVTETAAVANIHLAREFAERLRAIGCRFALDDFGAGFGSFYYLKHLPFDYLKIDGEFISNCLDSRTDQLVIRAVVDIAQGLGKETVAEFVADAALMDFLRGQGVDFAQGFHIGRPQPVAEALGSPGVRPRLSGP